MIFFFFPQTKQGNEQPGELNTHLTVSLIAKLQNTNDGDGIAWWGSAAVLKTPLWDPWNQIGPK